jgi:hypothetical protein
VVADDEDAAEQGHGNQQHRPGRDEQGEGRGADGQDERGLVGTGAEGVHGEDDEQCGEHEVETLEATQEGFTDQAADERSGGPGGVQAELGPQDAAADERVGIPAGGEGVGLTPPIRRTWGSSGTAG